MFPFGHAPLVGLDIGSTMVKAVALKNKGGHVVVESAAITPSPAGAISDGIFLDPPAIAASIDKLWREQGLRGNRIALAVGGEGVFLARLKLEQTGAHSLEKQIRGEMARLAPFPLDEAKLDFQVLEDGADSQWVDILAVAARKRQVDGLVQLVSRLRKAPVVMDATACALVNAFEFNYQPGALAVTALAHLGAAWMTLCILRGSKLLLAKDLSLELARFSDEDWSMSDLVAVQLERIFESMDEIADEHPLEPRSRDIERLVLSGGACRMRGLDAVLHDRIGLPFEEMNPFRRMDPTGPKAMSRLVLDHVNCMPVAVGLALRGLDR